MSHVSPLPLGEGQGVRAALVTLALTLTLSQGERGSQSTNSRSISSRVLPLVSGK